MVSNTLHLTVNELRYLTDKLPLYYKHSDDIAIVADEKRIAIVLPAEDEDKIPGSPIQVGKVLAYMPRKQ